MIKPGEIVPLSVQISDANSKLKITAKVMSPANEVLFEGPLTHIMDGFYETKQFTMPDMDYVFALYSVKNNEDYANSSEIFYKSEVKEISEMNRALLDEYAPKYDNYYEGKISDEQSDGFLEGVLDVSA